MAWSDPLSKPDRPDVSSVQLVASVKIWTQVPLSLNAYAARLKTARPRRVMRSRDLVEILVSVIWRLISRALSPGPMTVFLASDLGFDKGAAVVPRLYMPGHSAMCLM
jgi:hypothetical protein